MSVCLITDVQIQALDEDKDRIEAFVEGCLKHHQCYLADFWDGLHYVITGKADEQGLPLAALKAGDVVYVPGGPTHAIFSSTATALATNLQTLSEEALWSRFDLEKMVKAQVYPIRPWLFPESAQSTFREMMFYFDRLRTMATQAAEAGQGLLFHRYEDW